MSTIWKQYGATAGEEAELVAYAQRAFDASAFDRPITCPMGDEPFVSAWESYVVEAERVGVAACLRDRLAQLRFPIATGISTQAEYAAAVKRGAGLDARATGGLQFAAPDALRLFVHPTAAGRVPVIVAGARADFVALVQALTCRNEPTPVPDSMGACIVAGYNNWDRVHALKREWEASPGDHSEADWSRAFAAIVPRKELYQDRFIILSSGPYSGVAAAEMGLAEQTWRRTSLIIRLEHECAHYFTRKALGSMRNSILDELIADYAGIVAATGGYRADWFLRFLGLESRSGCRAGGRLHNYRGSSLSDGAFTVLQSVVRRAAEELEKFTRTYSPSAPPAIENARAIVALAYTGLDGLAAGDAPIRLTEAWTRAFQIICDGHPVFAGR
jgi:hypothetical protein